jgi:hypothetical protein
MRENTIVAKRRVVPGGRGRRIIPWSRLAARTTSCSPPTPSARRVVVHERASSSESRNRRDPGHTITKIDEDLIAAP